MTQFFTPEDLKYEQEQCEFLLAEWQREYGQPRKVQFLDGVGELYELGHGLVPDPLERFSPPVPRPGITPPTVPLALDAAAQEATPPLEEMSGSASTSGRVAERGQLSAQRRPRLETYAIGTTDGTKWTILRRRQNRWEDHGKLRVPTGRQTDLLFAFHRGGGFLGKDKAIRLVNEHPSLQDACAIFEGTLKPAVSRLRKTICGALGLPEKVDPLPWQGEVRGWRAAVQIGNASLEDSQYSGAKGSWRFWTEVEDSR